jgi:hypothetical protein
MKYGLALLAAATGALAASNGTSNGTVAYTTMVVTALTTFCPYATELTHNGITYTVTEATTLTITDCPCTVTHVRFPLLMPQVSHLPFKSTNTIESQYTLLQQSSTPLAHRAPRPPQQTLPQQLCQLTHLTRIH